MMKVPPLNLVGMDHRLPLTLPFNPELLWRYNMAPQHSGVPSSPSAAAAVALSRTTGCASSIPSPLAFQLPFAFDIKHTIPISLAADPRLWSREDVVTFLHWCEREFDLPSFNADKFQMNGKALCLLTKVDLEQRAPSSGDIIHNALQLLTNAMTCESPLTPQTPSYFRSHPSTYTAKELSFPPPSQNGPPSVTLSPLPSIEIQAGSPSEHSTSSGNSLHHHSSPSSSASSFASSNGNPSDDSEYESVGESPDRSPINQSSCSPSPMPIIASQFATGSSLFAASTQTATMKPQTHHGRPPASANAPSQSNSKQDNGEYNNNGRLLWDFLQQLLNDRTQRYSNYIAWKNLETGIFKIVDPPGLAKLWGIQKNHLSMNYDKMSRALRYYYRVNILRKVQGERHCYQFLRNPGELKNIKNISLLRHQTSPMSLTTKTENEVVEEEEFDDLPTDLTMDAERSKEPKDHKERQTMPIETGLTTKTESSNDY